jgi:hypothetical protein
VLVPVIAGSVKRIINAIPRGAPGFLKKNAHVPHLVRHRRLSAETLGDGGMQFVGALPGRVTWTTIAVSGTRTDRSRALLHTLRKSPVSQYVDVQPERVNTNHLDTAGVCGAGHRFGRRPARKQ